MNPSLFDTLARSRIVRNYEESFTLATGFVMKLQPAAGTTELNPFVPHANPFCGLMCGSPQAREICNRTFAAIRNKVAEKRAPVQSCCVAGLTHVAVPVLSAGEHIATIYGGQLMRKKPTKRAFNLLARQLVKLGLEDQLAALEQAWFQTPVVSEKQMQAIMYLLESFAVRISQHAATQALEPVAGEPAEVARAREFIQSRFSEPVTMHDAARHLRMSALNFSRLFKRALGMTFIHYLTLYRVEKSKTMLADFSAQIRAIAFQSGFHSISQFNRSFRACAGMSPTQYRAMLEGADPLLLSQEDAADET
jgi:AraC-like DNA-binding protein/ligand-binding sensor protein